MAAKKEEDVLPLTSGVNPVGPRGKVRIIPADDSDDEQDWDFEHKSQTGDAEANE